MVQRLSVSIPDSLAERLEPLKGRINVSGLLQRALEKEITMQDALSKVRSKKDELKARYLAKEEEVKKSWFDVGKQEGIDLFMKMDPDEDYLSIKKAEGIMDFIGREPQVTISDVDWHDLLCDDWGMGESLQAYADEPGFDEEVYAHGVIEGVVEAYNEVMS